MFETIEVLRCHRFYHLSTRFFYSDGRAVLFIKERVSDKRENVQEAIRYRSYDRAIVLLR